MHDPAAPAPWTVETVRARVARFATHRAADGYAPLYATLTEHLAGDDALLTLAARARPGQSPPDLLLACVHYLLARDPGNHLAGYYATLTSTPRPPDAHAYRLFTRFVADHHDELADLLAVRLVQTNEPRRATYLLPALAAAGRVADGPLGLVEVGASAGLTLILDRYGYDFGPGGHHSDPTSPLQLTCELRGRRPLPPTDATSLDIGWRAGLDLNPLHAADPDDRAWLHACVWADHPARAARLTTALALAITGQRPVIHPGDAVDVLPTLIASVPDDLTVCVFHTAVAAHFSDPVRAAFAALVPALSRDRPLLWVQAEPDVAPGEPRLRLTACRDGAITNRWPLGYYDPHGAWLNWTATTNLTPAGRPQTDDGAPSSR